MAYNYYYYNGKVDSKGNHEVHTEDCTFYKYMTDKQYIGYCQDCAEAINRAKSSTGKYNFDGCYFCCRPCHKG